MCVSVHPRGAQPSRTDAARSWTGPSAPVLGARGVLAVPCPPTGAAQVSVVRVGVAVRHVVEGSVS